MLGPKPRREELSNTPTTTGEEVTNGADETLSRSPGLGVAGAATLAAPAIAQSMPELKWRMTASWPKTIDTLWGGVELMAKYVAEATDNKFQI